MAALSELFLSPLGLLALLSVVPLLLLYLVRPEPTRFRLPTLEFLAASDEVGTDQPAFERLRRNLLLLLQLLVLVLVALALASPYVTTLGTAQVEETVVVLDTSASMTVRDAGGQSRFAAAQAIAREELSRTTSLVTAGSNPQVRLQRGGEEDALTALRDVEVTEADGDLAAAISQASAVADEDARILVLSDFAGRPEWRETARTARARGYTVDLRRVGGSVSNVGIVDAEYGRTDVTVSVKSYADREVTRTVSLGEQRERLTLAPGDVGTATFTVPPGNREVRLSPGDRFPVDDHLAVAGPESARMDVLLVTNEEDRYLVTALSVLDEVDLTVARPPTTLSEPYDVVVFSNVDRERLLRSTRQQVEGLVRDGGGVVVAAQPDLERVPYGPLVPVRVNGTASNPAIRAREDPLTTGIGFPPPDTYLRTELKEGSSAVLLADDSPLVARGRLGEGRTLYYGYIESASQFQFNYQYPVFVKRMVYEAAGREPIAASNLPSGSTLSVANGTAVTTPGDGERVESGTLRLDEVGFYRVAERRYAASLVSETESNVSAPALGTGPGGGVSSREEEVPRPLDLSPLVAIGALAAVFGELALLRWRGDL
jgi:hypothetical protein